jgi:hypothetical protein
MIHVGFDNDGVFRNFYRGVHDEFLKDYPEMEPYMFDPDNAEIYRFENMLSVADESWKDRLVDFCFNDPETSYRVYRNAPAYESQVRQMKEGYRRLKKAGAHVTICTTQKTPWQQRATIEWLHEHKIPYDNVIMVHEHKGLFNLDYLIDDHLNNVLAVEKSGGTGVLKRMPHNRDSLDEVDFHTSSIENYVTFVLNDQI